MAEMKVYGDKQKFQIQEYNGTYSIVSVWVNKDGQTKANFVKQEFGKGNEKVTALKITLGNKDEAVEALLSMANEVSEYDQPPF